LLIASDDIYQHFTNLGCPTLEKYHQYSLITVGQLAAAFYKEVLLKALLSHTQIDSKALFLLL
jgi:hypothetical protein